MFPVAVVRNPEPVLQ